MVSDVTIYALIAGGCAIAALFAFACVYCSQPDDDYGHWADEAEGRGE